MSATSSLTDHQVCRYFLQHEYVKQVDQSKREELTDLKIVIISTGPVLRRHWAVAPNSNVGPLVPRPKNAVSNDCIV